MTQIPPERGPFETLVCQFKDAVAAGDTNLVDKLRLDIAAYEDHIDRLIEMIPPCTP